MKRYALLALTILCVLALARPAAAQVVISQIYGGGGNSGATLRNDFVELLNTGSSAVSLTGWCVQYASATGSFTLTNNQNTPLTGSIGAGAYYVVQLAQGAGGTTSLPTPDATGLTAMGATAGKVALLNSCVTALAAGEGVSGGRIVDFVGYGSTANLFEGTGPTPAPSNTNAILRGLSGCTDNNNNSADFATGAPSPRNSASPVATCGGPPPPPPPITAISVIQGTGNASPLAGNAVRTTGVVTATIVNGFFIQTPDASADADPATSEGIFVFTGSSLPAAAVVGNMIEVTGLVTEFRPSADPASPPITEITGPSVVVVSAGNPLPATHVLTLTDTSAGGTPEQLERFEGMRVSAGSLTVTGPTGGSKNEASAVSASNGVFYAVLQGTPRPFREPGIDVLDPLPSGAPPSVPRFDTNPERLRVDSDAQPGASAIDVAAGATVVNVTGVLHYGFRTYTILPDPFPVPGVSGNAIATPVPSPLSSELTVGSLNVERFFDTTDDAGVGDVALTPAAFTGRLNKASMTVRRILGTPDVLGVVEMENLATLQALAAQINADAVAGGGANPGYQAFLSEGNDPGGIDVGFLVRQRISVVSVVQIGATATFINPDTGLPETLFDRPPLVLKAAVNGFPFTVIVNHLRSLNGVETRRVQAKRRLQAEFVANYVQGLQTANPNENIVVAGDFNAFEFNDGYADLMGALKGAPAPANMVVAPSPDLVNPDFINLTDNVAAPDRYSYVFDGSAQTLDHILISRSLLSRLIRVAHGRSNADFPEVLRSDFTRPERLSDHDGVVAYFSLANQPPTVDAGPDFTLALPRSAVMAGSVMDDGLPSGTLRFRWSQVSGPGMVTFINPAVLNAIVRFPMPGTYALRLVAGDGQTEVRDEVTVTVVPDPNQAPVVDAGAGQTVVAPDLPVTVTLSGSASDDGLPGERPMQVTWSVVSAAGSVSFANRNSAVTTVLLGARGTYVLRLTATDGRLVSSATTTIVVQ